MARKKKIEVAETSQVQEGDEEVKRTVHLAYDPKTQRIAIKLPVKNTRWKGSFATFDQAMDAAVKEIGHGFGINYVKPEGKN